MARSLRIKESGDRDYIYILACLEAFGSRHGMPRSILTNQGKQFENDLFKNFHHAFSIQMKRNARYHPAYERQIGRFNGTLVTTIARFVSADQRDCMV